jgi:hypothetical protein
VRVRDNVETSSARCGQRKLTRNDRVAGADQWLPYKIEICTYVLILEYILYSTVYTVLYCTYIRCRLQHSE